MKRKMKKNVKNPQRSTPRAPSLLSSQISDRELDQLNQYLATKNLVAFKLSCREFLILRKSDKEKVARYNIASQRLTNTATGDSARIPPHKALQKCVRCEEENRNKKHGIARSRISFPSPIKNLTPATKSNKFNIRSSTSSPQENRRLKRKLKRSLNLLLSTSHEAVSSNALLEKLVVDAAQEINFQHQIRYIHVGNSPKSWNIVTESLLVAEFEDDRFTFPHTGSVLSIGSTQLKSELSKSLKRLDYPAISKGSNIDIEVYGSNGPPQQINRVDTSEIPELFERLKLLRNGDFFKNLHGVKCRIADIREGG